MSKRISVLVMLMVLQCRVVKHVVLVKCEVGKCDDDEFMFISWDVFTAESLIFLT